MAAEILVNNNLDCFHRQSSGKQKYVRCQCNCNGGQECEIPTEKKCPIDFTEFWHMEPQPVPCSAGCPCELCEDKSKWDEHSGWDGPFFVIPGETFSPDGCNTCKCSLTGKSECTRKPCPKCKKNFLCPRCIDNFGNVMRPDEQYYNAKQEPCYCTKFSA